MRHAVRLARLGASSASPNPLVGAIVVREGKIVGEGFHKRAGGPHAERIALDRAGARARGATLFVTLEPCSRWGRTPPCAEALIAAGIRRLYVGTLDPHPDQRGGGIRILKRKMAVRTGLLEKECRRLNPDFLLRIRRQRPFVILKLAASLDGKIATPTGDSKWITGPAARRWVHRLRAGVDGILTGHGTVERDDPLLLPRGVPVSRTPLRVVADTHLDLAPTARIFSSGAPGGTILATSVTDPAKHLPFAQRGVVILTVPERDRFLDLRVLMSSLAAMGVGRLLIEGGSRIAGSALDLGLVDRIHFFYAPKILAGHRAVPMVGGKGVEAVRDAHALRNVQATWIGTDLLVSGDVVRPSHMKSTTLDPHRRHSRGSGNPEFGSPHARGRRNNTHPSGQKEGL